MVEWNEQRVEKQEILIINLNQLVTCLWPCLHNARLSSEATQSSTPAKEIIDPSPYDTQTLISAL